MGKNIFRIANTVLAVLGALATAFTCVLAIAAFAVPQAFTFVLPPFGATPEPQVIYLTAVLPNPVVQPTYTPFPVPTPYPTYTPYPTSISPPTSVPPSPEIIIATNTPAPTPEPSLLFFDDFDDGLDPAWEIVTGDTAIVNQKLTTSSGVTLLIGDPSWTDYAVECENWMPRVYDYNAISVRVNGDNRFTFRYRGWSDNHWTVSQGGVEQRVPNSGSGGLGKAEGVVKVVVVGNEYRAYLKGVRVSSLIDDRFPSGRVGITLHPGAEIDNFSVHMVEE